MNRLITIGEAILRAIQELEVQQEIPMNRQQAAAYLGVSVSTINNYAKRGLKPVVKNGIAGYLPSDLNKFRK